MKNDRELKRKYQDLSNIKAQVRDASQAYSAEVRKPWDAYSGRRDLNPQYAGVKFKNKADKLREHQSEIEAEIIMLRADTERLAEIEKAQIKLADKRAEIEAELAELKEKIISFNLGGRVFLGGDPKALAAEYQGMLDHAEALKAASDAVVAGFKWGSKL